MSTQSDTLSHQTIVADIDSAHVANNNQYKDILQSVLPHDGDAGSYSPLIWWEVINQKEIYSTSAYFAYGNT